LELIGKFVVQVEFIAEDEMVEIVPNLRMDALNLISVIIVSNFTPLSLFLFLRPNLIAYNLLGGFWSFLSTNNNSSAALASGGVEEEREVHYSAA
jgi:hypothetical protein